MPDEDERDPLNLGCLSLLVIVLVAWLLLLDHGALPRTLHTWLMRMLAP